MIFQLQVLHKPHKCYLKVSSQLLDCFWLKYGNRVPKLKVSRDHENMAKIKSSFKCYAFSNCPSGSGLQGLQEGRETH